MKKLVRESIDIYGPGYTTDVTWEIEDKEGNPIKQPYKDTRNIEDDPHIPIAPVPSPKKLPVIVLFKQPFYIDSKLKQIRHTNDPYFFVDLSETELTGLLNLKARFKDNPDYNFTYEELSYNIGLKDLFDEIDYKLNDDQDNYSDKYVKTKYGNVYVGAKEFKGTTGYDVDGFPFKYERGMKIFPKGYKLMRILEYVRDNTQVTYRQIQAFAWDITYGEGNFEKVYKNSIDRSNRGYYGTNLNKWVNGWYVRYEDYYWWTVKKDKSGDRKWNEPLIKKLNKIDSNKKLLYGITPAGEKKIDEIYSYLSKYQEQ
jgi:hypothetical protein